MTNEFSASTSITEQGFCVIEMLFDSNERPIDYRYLEVNAAFERQTGLENVVGKTMCQLVANHEDDWLEIYGKVALTGKKIHFKRRAAALNRWYEVYAFRVTNSTSRQVAILFQDISRYELLTTKYRQFEDDFLAKANEGIFGVYHCDFNGNLLSVNQKFCDLLGYGETELVGDSLAKLMHPKDLANNQRLLERMTRKGLPYQLEQTLLHRDNSEISVKIYVLSIGSLINSPEFAYAGVKIIGDRSLPLPTPPSSKVSWLQMTESIRDVFWISNPTKPRILYVSPAYEEIWGRSRGELYRDSSIWIDTVHPQDRHLVLETANATMQRGHGEIEYRIFRPDGSIRWIEDRGYALRTSQNQLIVGVAREIGERKLKEAQLEQSNRSFKFLIEHAFKLLRHSQPDRQIPLLLEQLASILNLQHYFYYLLSDDGTYLRLEASKDETETTRSIMGTINLDKTIETIEGVVVKSEGMLELSNVRQASDPRQARIRSLGITAYACYALIVKDRAVGVLAFGKDTASSFTSEETMLLRSVRDLVTMAIERRQ